MFQRAKMKRVFAAFLAVAFVLTAIAPTGVVKAAEKVPAKSVKITTEDNLKVLVIGKTYQLSYTTSPKNSTDKVTFTSSDKNRATVTTKGLVTPKKAGAVSITAKTTSGVTKKVTYLVTTANGTTSVQSRIAKILAASNLDKAAIRNLTSTGTFTIAAGDYSSKDLNVRTPKADVKNYGTFKSVTITDVKSGTWHEFGKNNSFDVKDDDVKITVDKAALVKAFNLLTEKAKVAIEAAGVIEKVNVTAVDMKVEVKATETAEIKNVVLDKKAELVISGDAKKVVVEVTKDAEGSKLTSSVPVEVSAGAKVEVKLEKGAEGSTLEKTSADVKITVDNKTTEKVEIKTEGSDKVESVESGKSNDTTTGGGGGSYAPDPVDEWKTATEEYKAAEQVTHFVLPKNIDSVTSAIVIVSISNNTATVNTEFPVNATMMSKLNALLSNASGAVSGWQARNDTSPNQYGIKITNVSGSSDNNKKTVTYNASGLANVNFTVELKDPSSADRYVTVQAGNTTYALKKVDAKTLSISGDVGNMVTFKVK